MQKLNTKIVQYLSKKMHKKETTIRKNISLLRGKYARCTLNAVAHIYAMQFGISVLQKLDKQDRQTLPNIEVGKNAVVIDKKTLPKKEVISKIIDYETGDYFKKEHMVEINRAYTKGCYTSVNILARKIIENLIIDILKQKYPPNTRDNKELYYDTDKNRFKDFSIVLNNLYRRRNDFGVDGKKIIERLVALARRIKNDANDKTHSWFYIVKRKKEIDDLDIQTIIELIKKLEYSLV